MSLPWSPATWRKLLFVLLAILLLLLIATIIGEGAPRISIVFEGAMVEIEVGQGLVDLCPATVFRNAVGSLKASSRFILMERARSVEAS